MRKQSDTVIFNCLICKEDKPTLGMGHCEHRRVCLYCTMKSRLLYNDIKCPVCNAKLDNVFIVNHNDLLSFEELVKGKEYYYQDDDFDASGLYYTTIEAKEEALMLRGFNCPIRKCRSEAFENIQTLTLHLNKVHRKYYCDCCLRDDKKFLAETEIYNQEQLKEHIEYGEYDNGILVYPPHPLCPFCNLRFYNDEGLFRHMNGTHFICQLCKDRKSIVFYSVLDNLLSHYKDSHFCCPYQECLDDIYVVFEKEEELLTHLITKHKVTNATDKLTQLLLEGNKAKFGPKGVSKGNNNNNNNNGNYINGYVNKDQFNFSQYITDIKAGSEKYMKDMEKQKKYTKAKKQQQKEGSEEDYYGNTNDDYYGNIDNNKDYYYDNYYGNSNQNRRGGGGRGRGRGGRGKKRGKGGYNNNDNYGYDNQTTKYYNKYSNHNDNVYTEEIEVSNLNQFNNNSISTPSTSSISTYEPQSNSKKHFKTPQNTFNQSRPRNIDYSFIFNHFLHYIKEYLINKINKDKTPEDQFLLAKEIIYQLIIIIDKLETYQKLFELTFIHSFGIDMEITKELKACLNTSLNGENEHTQSMLHSLLDEMSIKNILIFYKYIQTSAKKVDGLFYKLDLEQIDSDLYEDFVQRPYDKEKEREKERNMEKNKKDNNNKGKKEQPLKSSEYNYNKEKSNLNYLFKKDNNNPNDNKEISQTKEHKPISDESNYKSKSKLAMLLDSSNANSNNNTTKEVSGHKKISGKQKEFKMSNFNFDKDFPAFK